MQEERFVYAEETATIYDINGEGRSLYILIYVSATPENVKTEFWKQRRLHITLKIPLYSKKPKKNPENLPIPPVPSVIKFQKYGSIFNGNTEDMKAKVTKNINIDFKPH